MGLTRCRDGDDVIALRQMARVMNRTVCRKLHRLVKVRRLVMRDIGLAFEDDQQVRKGRCRDDELWSALAALARLARPPKELRDFWVVRLLCFDEDVVGGSEAKG